MEQNFFEETGIKDMSKDMTLDNIMKKYDYDMNKYEKKLAKMK